ncbi:MAG TPA: 50S ribosomal protein L3 [Firmicutes bacterium]|jgi:large subunit ribosomal protein L3|nr:50S ribosomal protein L3 [Bacillota bacterium]
MKKGILAKKVGMTQVFDEMGRAIPVTIMEAGPCTVISKRLPEKDGYRALQVGFKPVKENRLNSPQRGHFKNAGVDPLKYVRELRLDDGAADYEVGQEIKADIFAPGEYVDVTGISKGKGFAGSIKRHGHSRGAMTHGSRYHRGPGSLGGVDAARVFKGHALPGRMGGERVTVQKLKVIKADPEKNILLVKGAVPGPRGSLLIVKNSVKVS